MIQICFYEIKSSYKTQHGDFHDFWLNKSNIQPKSAIPLKTGSLCTTAQNWLFKRMSFLFFVILAISPFKL